MKRQQTVVINWQYALSAEKGERTPFSIVEVRLQYQSDPATLLKPRNLRMRRFSIPHCDLTVLEHQFADMGFLPILRGESEASTDISIIESVRGNPSATAGCLMVIILGIAIAAIVKSIIS